MSVLKWDLTFHGKKKLCNYFFYMCLNYLSDIILDSLFLLFQTPETFQNVVCKVFVLSLLCFNFQLFKMYFFPFFSLSSLKCDLLRPYAVLNFPEHNNGPFIRLGKDGGEAY